MIDPTASGQKSVTLPEWLQSPSEPQLLTGSFLGPPRSPVRGFTSPSKSGRIGVRASGWTSRSPSFADNGVWAAWSSRSNSRCSSLGKGGGDGRLSGMPEDMTRNKTVDLGLQTVEIAYNMTIRTC